MNNKKLADKSANKLSWSTTLYVAGAASAVLIAMVAPPMQGQAPVADATAERESAGKGDEFTAGSSSGPKSLLDGGTTPIKLSDALRQSTGQSSGGRPLIAQTQPAPWSDVVAPQAGTTTPETVLPQVADSVREKELKELATRYRKMTPRERRELHRALDTQRLAVTKQLKGSGPDHAAQVKQVQASSTSPGSAFVRELPAVTTDLARELPPATIELSVRRPLRIQEISPSPDEK